MAEPNDQQPRALSDHPADIADRLQQLGPEEAAAELRQMPGELAAGVLAEMDEDSAAGIAKILGPDEAGVLLGRMADNEAADITAAMPRGRRRKVLAALDPAQSRRVAALMTYPEDSAGGLMSDTFIALPLESTIRDCLEMLRRRGEEDVALPSYLYVTDHAGRLAGVITLRDLVFRAADRKLGEILRRDVKFVRVTDDRETVARLFSQYHYLALPVLEADDRLAGIVQASQVINVVQDEATEDMQLMVGLSGEEHAYTPWRRAITRRLPWLLINLATAFLAAAVVGIFEDTIAKWTALAVFLPIIAGQGGNAGMQTLTVIIRAIALGELSGVAARQAFAKEVTLGLVNGLAIGLVVGVVGWFWKGSVMLGVIVSVAMFLNMMAAALSGVLIPFALRSLRIDPALASSIFLTTVTDVLGFFFFLGLGALALHLF